MKYKKTMFVILLILVVVGSVFAASIYTSLDMRGQDIYNVTNVNATNGFYTDITTTNIDIDLITTANGGNVTSNGTCAVLLQGSNSVVCVG